MLEPCLFLADIVAKVENRTTVKISQKLISRPLRCCIGCQCHYGDRGSILDQAIWSLTSSRAKRISGSKNFCSTHQKDFCNKRRAKFQGKPKKISIINSFRVVWRCHFGGLSRQGHTSQTYIEHGLCTGKSLGRQGSRVPRMLRLQSPSFRALIPLRDDRWRVQRAGASPNARRGRHASRGVPARPRCRDAAPVRAVLALLSSSVAMTRFAREGWIRPSPS
ncbi:hypothetical protein ABIF63_000286 [Bradyrhizobium japonicum]|uniref:Uncharacterized protein n=1 Tax=Bradyrhizobium japonicum TaxID=375 RepID=A0ABV2RGW7_BRAJP